MFAFTATGTCKAGKSDARIPEAVSTNGHDGNFLWHNIIPPGSLTTSNQMLSSNFISLPHKVHSLPDDMKHANQWDDGLLIPQTRWWIIKIRNLFQAVP